MKYIVFPADVNGKILRGFCPTLCDDEIQVVIEAERQLSTYKEFGVNFDTIIIQPY